MMHHWLSEKLQKALAHETGICTVLFRSPTCLPDPLARSQSICASYARFSSLTQIPSRSLSHDNKHVHHIQGEEGSTAKKKALSAFNNVF
jgi:hypothetical protein